MKNQSSNIFWLLLLLILHLSASSSSSAQHHEQPQPPQVYIVCIGEHSGEKTTHEIEDNHHLYISSIKGSKEEAKASLIYSYKNVINGFSALLTQDEASKLSGKSKQKVCQKCNLVDAKVPRRASPTLPSITYGFNGMLNPCNGF